MNNSIWTRDLEWKDVAPWLIFGPILLMFFVIYCVGWLFKPYAKGH